MLSIIIPSKNEPYLDKTVADLHEHARGMIEVLVGDDGKEGIGQRAMMNKLAKKAKYPWIMKLDAHCSVGIGFDEIMLEDIRENWILAPILMPLDAERWIINHHKQTTNYVFDSQLVMHYAPNTGATYQETMCLQGSCFMMSTKNYWDWNICDESLGSWGGQAAELGIKAYLNGGACYTTKRTYYGHLFRHSEEDFPYKRNQAEIDEGHQEILKKLKTPDICPLVAKYNYPIDWTHDPLCYN